MKRLIAVLAAALMLAVSMPSLASATFTWDIEDVLVSENSPNGCNSIFLSGNAWKFTSLGNHHLNKIQFAFGVGAGYQGFNAPGDWPEQGTVTIYSYNEESFGAVLKTSQ